MSMVKVEELKKHIEKVNCGFCDFEEIDMNLRADLVSEGYSVEEVANMSEEEVVAITDMIEDGDCEKDDNDNEWGLRCPNCGELLNMRYTDSPRDGYWKNCKCGYFGFVDIQVIDAMCDEMCED